MSSDHTDGENFLTWVSCQGQTQFGIRIPNIRNDALRDTARQKLLGQNRSSAMIDRSYNIAICGSPVGNSRGKHPIGPVALRMRVACGTMDIGGAYKVRIGKQSFKRYNWTKR